MAPKKDILQPNSTPPTNVDVAPVAEQKKETYARVILFEKTPDGKCSLKIAKPVKLELTDIKVLVDNDSAAQACVKLIELAQPLASRDTLGD